MIGICIKYFHENYGGMLQAFATIKYFENKGYNYELIRYKKKIDLVYIFRNLPRVLNKVLQHEKFESLQKKIKKIQHQEFRQNDDIRLEAFAKFRDENFKKISPLFYGMRSLRNGSERYSMVITGSDQLWSPSGLPTNFYNLMFVPDDIIKVSIASSFGVKNIPWYQRRRTKEFLTRFDYISMREVRGKEIVQELTGKDVPVILDPVMFFTKTDWYNLIPSKIMCNEPYIFVYFLGNNFEYRKVINKAAEKLNCKIVTIRHADQYVNEDENFGDFAPYDVDPGDFLNYLRGASYICTDSFHASVFSIINHKKFLIFNRFSENDVYSKNSRIDSLCSILGLEDNRYNCHDDVYNQLLKNIEYETVDEKIKELREKTYEYLDNALVKES